MNDESSREAIEKKLEQTRRLAMLTSDQTTVHRLWDFADELKRKLQRLLLGTAGSPEDAIRSLARELWEQHGRPEGRDQEFWLKAEREILASSERDRQGHPKP